MRNGTVVESGMSRLVTLVSVSHSGVPSGDELAGLLPSCTTSTSFHRSPIASRSIFRTASGSSPGRVRMSMSTSALSGITFTFTPLCAMFGENVVRVAA